VLRPDRQQAEAGLGADCFGTWQALTEKHRIWCNSGWAPAVFLRFELQSYLLASLATHRLPDCLSLLSSQEVTSLFHRLWTEEKGQDIAEYAVMLALILVLVVGTIRLVGSNANNVFSSVASSVH